MSPLPERVRALLAGAVDAYADRPPIAQRLADLLDGFGAPLSIAVTGPPHSGRTTLIEALYRQLATEVRLAEAGTDADARLDLLPYPSATPEPAPAGPCHTIAVLARADDVSAGQVDGLGNAKILARRRQRDPAVWQSCQAVVAVSGLIGLAGHTLGTAEHAALAVLAGHDLGEHLLSADRFLAPQLPVPVDPATRADLLDRLGLAGLRLALVLARTAPGDPAALAQQLVNRSGLADLATAIEDLFLSRPAVLKAHAALVALRAIVDAEPPQDAQPLLAGLDRARANVHEVRELRLLAGLRAGNDALRQHLRDEAYRLVGGQGTGLAARLDLPEGASHGYAWKAATTALRRWRAEADEPGSPPRRRAASAVVARSCEAIVTELGAGR